MRQVFLDFCVMASCEEEETAKLEFQPEKFDAVFEKIRAAVELEFERIKSGLHDDEKRLQLSALVRVEAKLKYLLLHKLESRSRSMPFEEIVKEAESALLEMKRRSEKEGFDFSPLEMQLEQHIAKSKLLLEEMGLTRVLEAESPMLKMYLKEHISNVEFLLEELEREESTMESPVLRTELIEELQFLLEELEIESMLLKPYLLKIGYMIKRILFLEKTKLEQKKEGERSQMSEMELKRNLEELIVLSKKIEERNKYSRKRYWRAVMQKERYILEEMKSKGVESTINQFRENLGFLKHLVGRIESLESNDKLRLWKLRIELDFKIVELQGPQETLDEKLIMRVIGVVEKSVNLLEEMKSKQRGKEGIAKFKKHTEDLQAFLKFIIYLYGNIVDQKGELEYLLQETKKMQKNFLSEIIFNERHIEELEHRLEEVKQWERLPFRPLVQELLSGKLLVDQIVSKRELGKAKAQLEAMKVKLEQEMLGCLASLKKKREESKIHMPEDLPTVTEMDLKWKKKQSVASSTGEQKAPSTLDASQDVIVIGGCDQNGENLRSVEGYRLPDGTWFELPAMNKSRSFMACVVDGQNVIVSGGQSDGHTITRTIEGLNSTQSPLQWELYHFSLLVGLCGHAMVVHAGKLIVIGGFDDSTGRNSDAIYEIPLTPPHRARRLNSLPQPRAGHGVVLVNDKIFIFGGGRSPWSPADDVWVYNISENRCRAINNLPYPVQGMATTRRGNTVMLLGGVGEADEEMRDFISYDIESGKISYC